MKNAIGIVNYGIAGNIHSVKKAVEKVKGEVIVINHPDDFDRVGKIIIPGVGSFKDGMNELEKDGFIDPIKDFKGPVLGICLGMQLLAKVGYEYGEVQGLGIIDAEVLPLKVEEMVPNFGFSEINIQKTNDVLKELDREEFYFMHSYELVTNINNVSSTSLCADHQFVSSICQNNIYGVQFHPEKSRDQGLKLLENFVCLS